jgi:hypothetical protein
VRQASSQRLEGFLSFGLSCWCVVVYIFHMFGRKAKNKNRAMSADSESKGGCGGIVAVLFFGVFFAAGCGMLYYFAVLTLWGVYSASSWQPTPCEIVSSQLKESQGDDSTTYRIEIKYKYKVAGREYQSDRYKFFGISSNTGVESKRQAVRKHPPGKKTTCFVNPQDPNDAVIERGLTWDMLWGLFGVPFFIIGAGGLAVTFGLVKWNKAKPGQAEWMPTVKHQRHQSEWDIGISDDGPVTLRPKMGPVGKLLLILLFAGIWNGVVALIISKVIENIARGRTEWMLLIFAFVFGAVGLLLIGFVIHALLGLFTPRPTLTVQSAHIPIGGMLDLAWNFGGQTSSMSHLHIYLEGREEATYRRGTNTYTDKETFATLTLVDTTDPLEMPRGETKLLIPADTMHSFDAGHNDIIWALHIKGEIKRWPDVKQEYTLVLVPPGMKTQAAVDLEQP